MEITSLIDSSFIRSVKKSLFVPQLLRMNAIVGREEPRLIVTKEKAFSLIHALIGGPVLNGSLFVIIPGGKRLFSFFFFYSFF